MALTVGTVSILFHAKPSMESKPRSKWPYLHQILETLTVKFTTAVIKCVGLTFLAIYYILYVSYIRQFLRKKKREIIHCVVASTSCNLLRGGMWRVILLMLGTETMGSRIINTQKYIRARIQHQMDTINTFTVYLQYKGVVTESIKDANITTLFQIYIWKKQDFENALILYRPSFLSSSHRPFDFVLSCPGMAWHSKVSRSVYVVLCFVESQRKRQSPNNQQQQQKPIA